MSAPLLNLIGRQRATVPEVVAARVGATPDATFLKWDDQSWSYRDGFEEICRLAGWLAAERRLHGDSPRWATASFLANAPAGIWSWLGALHVGSVYVPINYGHRGAILEDMLVRSGAEVLVTDPAGLDHLSSIALGPVRSIVVTGDAVPMHRGPIRIVPWAELSSSPIADPEPSGVEPGDPAMVVYTSGTTGRSKAVLMSHNQICRGASATGHALESTPRDVAHSWLPLFHVAGQVDIVLSTLITGGAIALHDRFSLSRFWAEVERDQATIFAGFSNILEFLWELEESPYDEVNPLRVGMIGGVPKHLRGPFERRFGVRLCDVYGLTEAEPLALPLPGVKTPPGACGRANPDFEIAVQLGDGDLADPGEVGEIVARPTVPDVMFIGYENDEAATLEATKNLWFHTRDLGKLDADGFLYFIDRKRHAIRRRGENVSSWELETIVVQHPDVVECCAVGVPSPHGEDDIKVVVVPRPNSTIDPAEFLAWCEQRMARFMVPRFVVVSPKLPRSEAGKILKEQVRADTEGQWDVTGQQNVQEAI